jgi:squalene synthase HpnC
MHATPGLLTGVDHYENFPIASVLLPADLRPAVVAIYRFARYADDVADEGDAPSAWRLAELARLRDALLDPAAPEHPIAAQLRPHLNAHRLSVPACTALLSAFEQDVRVSRYADTDALLDYCRRSANPVGQLMLELFDCRRGDTLALSDRICTALQLINFAQDTAIDWRRGRLYLPQCDLAAGGLREADVQAAVAAGRAPTALRALLGVQVERAAAMLEAGAPLARLVPRRLGWELRAIVAGGRRIVERLRRGGYDPIAHRPALGWRDAPALLRLLFAAPAQAPIAAPDPTSR